MTATKNALVVFQPKERSLIFGPRQRERTRRVRTFWFHVDEVLNSLLVAALVAFSVLMPLLDVLSPAADAPAPRPVITPSNFVTAEVVRGDLSVKVTATGTVEPVRLVEVSSELSGNIKAVHVENNDRVKAGQLLAELNPDSLDNERLRAAAQVSVVQARIKEARAGGQAADKELNRKSTLAKKDLATARDLDMATASSQQSKASVEALRAELAIAEANLKIAEENFKKTRIVSPINGVVLRRNVEPGQTVAASLQAPILFRLAQDLGRMQIRVDVDEADALKVRDGQPAMFGVQALRDRMFEAKVEKLYTGAEIVQGVVTYKAILSFDNTELNLKPGMTATAEIEVEKVRGGLVVPNAALRFSPPEEGAGPDGASVLGKMIGTAPATADSTVTVRADATGIASGQRRVFVEQKGKLVPVLVKTGATDGARTHIVSGPLAEGQSVVVDIAASGP